MLHNHLRNFTSHKFLVDFDSPDQADYGSDGVDEFCGRVEITRHHVGGLVDTRQTVALGKGRGNGKQQDSCDKKMSFGHKSLFCARRIGYVLPTDEYCCYFRMLVVALLESAVLFFFHCSCYIKGFILLGLKPIGKGVTLFCRCKAPRNGHGRFHRSWPNVSHRFGAFPSAGFLPTLSAYRWYSVALLRCGRGGE